jgi:hypothetical protein
MALPAIRGSTSTPGLTDGTVTILATIISFLGVATLAVSVSTSLVQSGLDRYHDAEIVRPLIEDAARDRLLGLILIGFLVSLGYLLLVSASMLAPVAALPLPVVFAGSTLVGLVYYVVDRMTLFDPALYAGRLLSSLSSPPHRAWPGMTRRAMGQEQIAQHERALVVAGRLIETMITEGQTRDAMAATKSLTTACGEVLRMAPKARGGTPPANTGLTPARGNRGPVDLSPEAPRGAVVIAKARQAAAEAWLERAASLVLMRIRIRAIEAEDADYLSDWYGRNEDLVSVVATTRGLVGINFLLGEALSRFGPITPAKIVDGEWELGMRFLATTVEKTEISGGNVDPLLARRVAARLDDLLDRYLLIAEAQAERRSADPKFNLRKLSNWINREPLAFAERIAEVDRGVARSRVGASSQRLDALLSRQSQAALPLTQVDERGTPE